MIDTHCHLSDPRLHQQLGAVLQRAADAGVHEIVTIGAEPSDWKPAIEIALAHSNVRAAIGVHPCYCHAVDFSDLAKLRELLKEPGVVAVGEMGLDYFHAEASREVQRKFFIAQMEIAAELDLPVVIHSRSAIDDCLAVMASFPKVSAVYHCFTGNSGEARRIVERGYCIGFTGVVTFKNAAELRQIAADMPEDQILVETDAPWLSPEPMRKQKINEPALVMFTADVVAAARGLTTEQIDAITTANAKKLYRWSIEK